MRRGRLAPPSPPPSPPSLFVHIHLHTFIYTHSSTHIHLYTYTEPYTRAHARLYVHSFKHTPAREYACPLRSCTRARAWLALGAHATTPPSTPPFTLPSAPPAVPRSNPLPTPFCQRVYGRAASVRVFMAVLPCTSVRKYCVGCVAPKKSENALRCRCRSCLVRSVYVYSAWPCVFLASFTKLCKRACMA